MHETGFTKARSNGPIADAVERAGGSIARVFARADLPLELIDQPELLVPLRDQIRLLEYASREVGDAALSARLASDAGITGLGIYGARIVSAPCLEAALARANWLIGMLLQSATSIRLEVNPPWARWSYEISDAADVGRQKHEILALSYGLDLMRRFAGPRWVPAKLAIAGPPVMGRTMVEDVMSCDISRGKISAMIFPSDLLELPNINPRQLNEADIGANEALLPDPRDTVKCVEHLIRLALLKGRPRIEWVAMKMDLSSRSLQRHLNGCNTTFEHVMDQILTRRAINLLEQGDTRITELAYQLGYSDPCHFVRAFRRWTGQTPTEFRRRMGVMRHRATAA